MIDIKNYNHEMMTISAEEQVWTDKDCEDLKKQNVIYNKGCFALQIVPSSRPEFSPLVRLGVEDDGTIKFTPNSETFSCHWIDDLITVLEKAKEHLAKEDA